MGKKAMRKDFERWASVPLRDYSLKRRKGRYQSAAAEGDWQIWETASMVAELRNKKKEIGDLPPYCEVSALLCGSSTWLMAEYCRCPTCLAWHKDQMAGG